jgi:hypothetical protein
MSQQLPDAALSPQEVFPTLPHGAQRLAIAVHTLYGGSWDSCADDLRRRRAGQPYLYRLHLGLDHELSWVHRLAGYEQARGEPVIPDVLLEKLR